MNLNLPQTSPLPPSGDMDNGHFVVLIVDDTPENRFLLSSQLSLEGYQILQANGGRECLEMAAKHNPDIILLDVMMPDMNGFDTCKQLKSKAETHLIPVIMVTALRDVQYRIQGIEAGADEFLSRPHVREELLVRVRTLIRLKHARLRLENERNSLHLLYNTSRAVSTQLDLESMMAEIITQTQSAVGATKGNIMLLDELGNVTDKFLIRAGQKVEVSDRVTRAVMKQGLGGWLLDNKRGHIIEDISNDSRWVRLPDDSDEIGSAIGVPLSSPKRVAGVLILNHPTPGYFTQEHLALLETMGATVAAAIENAFLFKEISEEQQKLEAILAQSTDAIITTDEAWYIALFNRSAEQLFVMQAQDIVGKKIADVFELRPLHPVLDNQNHLAPREIKLPNGKTLYVTVSPIQSVGYTIVMQDVTEFKRIEQFRLEQERREKKLLTETFSRYMGPRLLEHVLSHEPGLMAKRERRRAVVMFADLRNWTGGMISQVTPDEAIDQLNEFFTQMMDIALENDGTVFELTADELLVGFNAPFNQPNAPYLALKTAVTMQKAFNRLQQKWYKLIGTKLGLGVGIDEGEIVMGNVGAESRLSFRMVGEAMNTAHRLVELAEDSQIIISQDVYVSLQDTAADWAAQFQFGQLGPVKLKGITTPQLLYYIQIPRMPLD